MHKNKIQVAVKQVGSQSALARLIGTSPQVVSYWLNGSKRGPSLAHILKIKKATGIDLTMGS